MMRFSFGFNFKRKAGSVSQRKAAAAGEGSLAGLIALHGGAAATWSGHSFVQLAREGYMRNPVAHRCVRLIAEAAAQPPLLLHDGNREFDSHPLLDLIRRPNPHQAGGAFFEALYGYLMLSGNAFIEAVAIDGEPRELHLLRPDQVTIRTDQRGWPVAYEHEAGGTRRRIAAAGGAEGPGVLHLKLFHPLDDQAGFAPLGAAAMALDLHNAAAIWNKALLDNSARPSGALVYQPKEGGNLSEDQYERLKSELEDGYSGARRAGRPMLLEGGLDWKAMALSPREMDFVEARHAAARDIALAFGVPPMLLGIPGDNTYANYQEANRAFYRLTVVPLVVRSLASMSAWLQPVYGEGMRLEPDLDQVPGLGAERSDLWERVGRADFLSTAEKREAVGYQGNRPEP